MAGTERQLNHATTYLSTPFGNHTVYLPIGRYAPLDFSLTLVLFKFQDLESHGRQSSADPDFISEKKLSLTWPGAKFTGNFALA